MLAILITKQPVVDFLNSVGVNYNLFKITMIGNKPEDIKNGALGDDMNEENDSFKKKQKPIDPKSKTPVLDNFCRDVSKAVEKGEIDPVVGRTTEIKRVSQILSRRKKNNPILIGEPGVGKCFIGDTQVVMRNDLTGEVFKATINEFLKTFTDTETTN
jgi:ATP-dependent Clp protease ATP-binding subunit ClpC